MTDLPIEPGSELDKALNALVDFEVGVSQLPLVTLLQMIQFTDEVHMLALGTRVWARRMGVRDPNTLVEPQYRKWYGEIGTTR